MTDLSALPDLVDASERRLGGSALVVGPLAYGCWRFAGTDTATAQAKIETALDCGMTLVDTADIYGHGAEGFGAAEALLGDVLRTAPHLRDRMVLATKGGICPPIPYDSSPEHLRRALDDSLRRLGVDEIDLWQIHRPDLLAHPEHVAATLVGMRHSGKVREIGVSNYSATQFDALQGFVDFPLVTHQPEFSVWHLDPIDDGVFDQCMARDVRPLAWSPLAGGRLVTGEGLGGRGTAGADVVATLDRIAEREGTDRTAVALAFVLAHPSRPVAIIGTQDLGRIRSSPAALTVHLDRNDVYDLVAASGRVLP